MSTDLDTCVSRCRVWRLTLLPARKTLAGFPCVLWSASVHRLLPIGWPPPPGFDAKPAAGVTAASTPSARPVASSRRTLVLESISVTSFPRSVIDARIGGLAHGSLTRGQSRTNRSLSGGEAKSAGGPVLEH